jgi:anti-sigma factor RsiW
VDTAATRSASSAGSGELASNSTSRERVSDDVRSAHFRSLLPGHLLDVVSTDQHTVKPWFAGKLDFAPRVANLDSAGFHLIGGRLDYVGGRHVVALVYGRRKHLVNLFLWPSTRDTDAQRTGSEQVIDGYTTRSWADGGMTYWAISDVQRADLDTLEQLYRSAAPGAKKPTP